jgi:hypothetical protein
MEYKSKEYYEKEKEKQFKKLSEKKQNEINKQVETMRKELLEILPYFCLVSPTLADMAIIGEFSIKFCTKYEISQADLVEYISILKRNMLSNLNKQDKQKPKPKHNKPDDHKIGGTIGDYLLNNKRH